MSSSDDLDSSEEEEELGHIGLGNPRKRQKSSWIDSDDDYQPSSLRKKKSKPSSFLKVGGMNFRAGSSLNTESLDPANIGKVSDNLEKVSANFNDDGLRQRTVGGSTKEFLSSHDSDEVEEERPNFGTSKNVFTRAAAGAQGDDESENENGDRDKDRDDNEDQDEDENENENENLYTFSAQSTLRSNLFGQNIKMQTQTSSKGTTTGGGRSRPYGALASSYGIGAKLLGKMGYVSGKGLGAGGKGIVEPIQQKLRPTLLGLGGIDEKTRQAKLNEAKKAGGKNKVPSEGKISVAHETRRPIAPKDVYKTIEELENDGLHIPSGFRHIVDMRQKKQSIIEDLSTLGSSPATPTTMNTPAATTPSDISERLDTMALYDKARDELEIFSQKWHILQSGMKYTRYELDSIKKEDDLITDRISIVTEVVKIVDELASISRSNPVIEQSIEDICELLDRLQFEFIGELDRLQLDLVAVAAIKPYFMKFISEWDPLDDAPGAEFRDYFLRWKILLRIQREEENHDSSMLLHSVKALSSSSSLSSRKRKTSSFESLIYNIWLPKVQSVLTNQWHVSRPASAILLLEEWDSILPDFVKTALLNRIVLPKLKRGLDDWRPSAVTQDPASVSSNNSAPHIWLFPWLPYLGDNLNEIIGEVKLKLVVLIKTWKGGVSSSSSSTSIAELSAWKQLIGEKEMDKIVIRHLVPKLEGYLRREFKVDPANQDMTPLDNVVIKWGHVLKPSLVAAILESEFFPKWLETLHTWLINPDASLTDISSWYQAWTSWFPEMISETSSVKTGFLRGLDLINDALDLDASQRYKLEHPSRTASRTASPIPKVKTSGSTTPSRTSGKSNKPQAKVPISSVMNSTNETDHDTLGLKSTFRDVVEEYCLSHDLFLIPQRKSHDTLGHLLYRITYSPSGQSGLLSFFDEDVLWIQPKGSHDYEPISLDDLEDYMRK